MSFVGPLAGIGEVKRRSSGNNHMGNRPGESFMPNHPLGAVLNRLRSALEPAEAETTDRELLKRFTAREEQAAFSELVRRHGPMVLGVCRRILGDAHAAEDAFQATFLVLVRRARAVPWRESLGGWLHGTARRVALRVRRAAGERRGVSPPVRNRRPYAAPLADPDPSEEAAARELRRVLDQELQGLPAKYRAPLVLCDLEGKTHEQAARELGWPKGSVAKRLNGGRERLRARLMRRGVGPAAALTIFTTKELTAAPAAALAAAALLAAHGGASTKAAALAKGVIQAMWMTKIVTAVVLTTALVVTGTLAGAGTYRAWGARAAAPAPAPNPSRPPAVKAAENLRAAKAVEVNGAEFRAYVQRECLAPAPGESRPLNFGLRITNTTDKPLMFYDALKITVNAADGQGSWTWDRGYDEIKRPDLVVIKPGKSYMMRTAPSCHSRPTSWASG